MMNLPNVESSDVIPIESPVVPKAEHTSNKISVSVKDSEIVSKKIAQEQMKKAVNDTTSAFRTSTSLISRLNTLIRLFPFAKWYRNKTFKANVVVRTPPPTELGDAPINIKALNASNVGSLNWLTSIVESPPLRVETDWKNA